MELMAKFSDLWTYELMAKFSFTTKQKHIENILKTYWKHIELAKKHIKHIKMRIVISIKIR